MRTATSPTQPKALSKSKLIAFRQCEKRLWLEVHRPELRDDSGPTQVSLRSGNEVGDIARRIYDGASTGVLLNAQADGYANTLRRSLELLSSGVPLFEAGYSAEGAIAFADVMLPTPGRGKKRWRMIEVKSTTSVKQYHRDDVALQAFVARRAGVPLASISLAYIDSQWVYPGQGDYSGLFKEEDLTNETLSREHEIPGWIAGAQAVIGLKKPPSRRTGDHCSVPYECGFHGHCSSGEPQAEFPIAWLPRVQAKALKAHLAEPAVNDLRHVPNALLNPSQLLVKEHTIAGTRWFDSEGARKALKQYRLPGHFLDFETSQSAIPRWAGTRPYAQISFQFSVHHLARNGTLTHSDFLDLSGNDPSRPFAEALLEACGDDESGPIFVYNAAFEKTRIKEAAERFRMLRKRLLALNNRIVDLLPVAQRFFYCPSQQGSWSIKRVLPAVVPELRYDQLEGVQDGGAAMAAYLEAVDPATTPKRKAEIEAELRAYCKLDTYAMVRLWQVFSGRPSVQL